MPPRGSCRRRAALLLAASLLLRAWQIAEVVGETGDEPMHVRAAHAISRGMLTRDTWWNPPLAYETLEASVRVLGDGPWGWRLRNVVLGALSPVLLALVALRLFPDRPRVAWMAGWLLALEPIHVLLSRGTWEEIQGVFLFLAAALLAVLATEGRRTLLWAGVALGGALASKHYFTVPAAVLCAWVLARRVDGVPPLRPAAVVLRLVAVPAAVYVACYLPWFAAGHGIAELPRLHLDALRVQVTRDAASYANRWLLATAQPVQWFVWSRPFCAVVEPGASWSRYHLVGHNGVAALLVLPAVAHVAAVGIRRRRPAHLLVAGLFAAAFVPLLLVSRPIFVYSAAAVLPFAFLAIALSLDAAWVRFPRAAAATLAATLAFGAYCWPLVTSRPVPNAAYEPVLRWATLVRPEAARPDPPPRRGAQATGDRAAPVAP